MLLLRTPALFVEVHKGYIPGNSFVLDEYVYLLFFFTHICFKGIELLREEWSCLGYKDFSLERLCCEITSIWVGNHYKCEKHCIEYIIISVRTLFCFLPDCSPASWDVVFYIVTATKSTQMTWVQNVISRRNLTGILPLSLHYICKSLKV